MPPRSSMQAVARTTVSPRRTVHDPSACLARWPVSRMRVLSPTLTSLRCFMIFFSFSSLSLSSAYNFAASEPWPAQLPGRWVGGPEATDICVGTCRVCGGSCLLAESEALDGGAITLYVLPLEIVE